MAENANLHAAMRARRDEFYTQLGDIAAELGHYAPHFRGKSVLCNCDDPYESNFFKYFALRFNALGLSRLVCTCYRGSPVAQTELDFGPLPGQPPAQAAPRAGAAYMAELTEVRDLTGDGATDLRDVELLLRRRPPRPLMGDGDFRSPECVELLREADIVVTNPPFSLFREYLALLVKHGKKFLILGNKNAITYKEVFPLIKENKIWVGVTPMTKDLHFMVPQWYIDEAKKSNRSTAIVEEDGKVLGRSPSIWFTNLDHDKRHYPLDLWRRYTPGDYPRYDNYDAINVDRVSDIPADYTGVMGVPITFLDKYCPEQFEIVGIDRYVEDNPHYGHRFKLNGKEMYARLLIRRRAD